jgi:site-specific recombinase XerD
LTVCLNLTSNSTGEKKILPMPNLTNLTPEIIKSYQDEISKNSSMATVKRKAISMNKFFDWAKDNGHIGENPMKIEKEKMKKY